MKMVNGKLVIEQADYDAFKEDRKHFGIGYKKQNNRKHSLPLFVYLILKNNSSYDNKLSQSQIIDILFDDYELEIERKSLSRTIHDLEDENVGIHSLKSGGIWFDDGYDYYE